MQKGLKLYTVTKCGEWTGKCTQVVLRRETIKLYSNPTSHNCSLKSSFASAVSTSHFTRFPAVFHNCNAVIALSFIRIQLLNWPKKKSLRACRVRFISCTNLMSFFFIFKWTAQTKCVLLESCRQLMGVRWHSYLVKTLTFWPAAKAQMPYTS